ncbi:lysoplasmalogenase [Acetanaerobacterium elongatum]|uniref:Uncharacterized membrane protein YhhN n=1 Tax=Acetanaerobacterium elongatum TaxID=258515 RepID=A0A1G9VL40_9FIRM|nr:lysoplasmalogenase [Acetanaerobacterium elongatum]SDM72889.1 Uncharacterized membrane protein YhhN [Acetanaerobacterium elongatum]
MIIALCAGMGISLAAYLQRSLKGGYVSQQMTKAVTSLFFIMIALAAYNQHKGDIYYFSLVLLGLICSLVGDILIQTQKADVRYDKQMLACGIGAFFVAHCFYIAAFIHLAPFRLWDIVIFAAAYAVLRLIFILAKLNFGKLLTASYIYLGAIMLMFTKALSLTLSGGRFTTLSILLLTGASLFVISDFILTFLNFYPPCKNNRVASLAVTVTYYVAQALFALSILLV